MKQQRKIKELQHSEIVWPKDCIKSIEKLWLSIYKDCDALCLVVWWIDLDVFGKLYNKSNNDMELQQMLDDLWEEYCFMNLDY
jgi:hypothetical protein